MFVPFDNLPEESRIWIYQAERELNEEEQHQLLQIGAEFIETWVTHGQPLMGSVKVANGYFVIIAVDDSQLPSGCSIDASVGLIRNLGQQLQVDFFGRTNVALWTGEQVKVVPLSQLKEQLKNGSLSAETLLFNTLAQDKKELETWIIPLRNSWLSRYLPQPHHN